MVGYLEDPGGDTEWGGTFDGAETVADPDNELLYSPVTIPKSVSEGTQSISLPTLDQLTSDSELTISGGSVTPTGSGSGSPFGAISRVGLAIAALVVGVAVVILGE